MISKTKVSFAVPKSLKKELQQRVTSDGYGLRGKSKWVCEALVRLFEYDNHVELIYYSDELHGLDGMEAVVLNEDIKDAVDNKILDVRRAHPELEGVKSRILRTAIVQRLIR